MQQAWNTAELKFNLPPDRYSEAKFSHITCSGFASITITSGSNDAFSSGAAATALNLFISSRGISAILLAAASLVAKRPSVFSISPELNFSGKGRRPKAEAAAGQLMLFVVNERLLPFLVSIRSWQYLSRIFESGGKSSDLSSLEMNFTAIGDHFSPRRLFSSEDNSSG